MSQILYSSIHPLPTNESQKSFIDAFTALASQADSIRIAVGYVSRPSLEELDRIIEECNIREVELFIGMYYIEGMPESSYRTALRINEKWKAKGQGVIRLIKPFKYHGKNYCFFQNEEPIAAIVGSANLGILKLDANNRRQYELSVLLDSQEEASEIATHIEQLAPPLISVDISEVRGLKLLREQNVSLSGIVTVTPVPSTDIEAYNLAKTDISFELPLKVPMYEERLLDDGKHFTKSNINVCYAAPRSARKARDWYEIQLTVSKEITQLPGYPEKNKPFLVVTDDGYRFLAHTTSDGNKQFNAVGDELLIGRWLKGRLVAAGLVAPVNDTRADVQREGSITREMLEEYGCNHLTLTKTTKTMITDNSEYDIWLLSMEKQQSLNEV